MDERPTLSIIISTYQRHELLRSCLRSVLAAKRPASGFEVVVVDDGGGLPEGIEAEFPGEEIRWVRLPENRGQASAQEAGRRRSQGDILAFLDDDCTVGEAWLIAIQRNYSTYPTLACVTGRVEAQETAHILSRTRQEIYNERARRISEAGFQVALRSKWKLPDCPGTLLSDHLSGGNFAIRRELLEAIGGFDQNAQFGNDRVMSRKLLEAGHAIAYDPAMLIYHKHDPQFRSLYHIARRKMGQRFAGGQAVRFSECLPLFLELLQAPFAIRSHPEMYRADSSRIKVYLAFTCIQALYALGGLLTFFPLYLKRLLR